MENIEREDTFSDKIYKLSELILGKYTVLSYEPRKGKYGKNYILNCISGKNHFQIWANSYIANYIEEINPKKEIRYIYN